jgi:hypothetical protein
MATASPKVEARAPSMHDDEELTVEEDELIDDGLG